jgi:hypothetical protein
VPVRLRLVHPVPTRIARNVTAVYRRGPTATTNAPGSAGQTIATRYQTRRKPAVAAWGNCHIFAVRAALASA